MLKSVLYYLMLIVTAVRLADIVYLLAGQSTGLPACVLIVSSVMILYGIILTVKKFIGSVRLGQLMAFFLVQILATGFNLTYVALAVPVQISIPETLMVGTFLDILVNGVIVYLCIKQRRTRFVTVGGLQ